MFWIFKKEPKEKLERKVVHFPKEDTELLMKLYDKWCDDKYNKSTNKYLFWKFAIEKCPELENHRWYFDYGETMNVKFKSREKFNNSNILF